LERDVRRLTGATLLVGTDLVEIADVAQSIRRFGEHYMSRVYTSCERSYCVNAGGDAAPHFAARFAAKEAVMKVLRPTSSDALTWKSIEVVRSAAGWCSIRLRGTARILARRAGLGAFAISLSHERHYATAVAVAERDSRRASRSPRMPSRTRADER
jgi:holo-[acyl-carrier protein] synthase